jgi:hypothetical protein
MGRRTIAITALCRVWLVKLGDGMRRDCFEKCAALFTAWCLLGLLLGVS